MLNKIILVHNFLDKNYKRSQVSLYKTLQKYLSYESNKSSRYARDNVNAKYVTHETKVK